MEQTKNISLRLTKNYYLMKKNNLKNVKGYFYPNNFKCFLSSKDFNIFQNLNKREKINQSKILDRLMRKIIIEKIIKKINDHNLLKNNIIKLTEKITKVKEIAKVKKTEKIEKVKETKKDKINKVEINGYKNITTEKLLIKYKNEILNNVKIIKFPNKFNINKFQQVKEKEIFIINNQLYKRLLLNVNSFDENKYEKQGLLIVERAKIENKKLLLFELTNITKLGFSKWISKMELTAEIAEEFANTNLNKMIEFGIVDPEEIKGKFYSFAGFVSKDGKINKKLLATLVEMKIIDHNGNRSRKLNWNDLTLLNTFEFEQQQNGNADIVIDDNVEAKNKKTYQKDTAIIKFVELRKKGMNSRNCKKFNVSYREYMTLRDTYKEFKEFEKEWN